MNKKLIVIILAVFMLVTIVIISEFGGLPAHPDKIASEIIFEPNEDDDYSVNDNGILVITMDINDLQPNENGEFVFYYQLNYVVNPKEAKDKSVTFHPKDISQDKFIEDISPEGLITFKFTTKIATTIEIVAKSNDEASKAQNSIIIDLKCTPQGGNIA